MPNQYGVKEKTDRCRICDRPLSYHQQVYNRICTDWRCKSALLDLEKAEYRNKAARTIGIHRSNEYPMIVVPGDPKEIQTQPQSRKQAHIDFLFDLSVQTLGALNGDRESRSGNPSVDLDPPLQMASDVCGICEGACCHLGSDRAFLDGATIRRFIAISGIKDPLEIVYAYYGRLPETAVENACVYQTDRGCALPRWMRADLCNAYRCEGLQRVERTIAKDGNQRFCILVRRDNRIMRAAFIRNHGISHYPSIPTESLSSAPCEPSTKALDLP